MAAPRRPHRPPAKTPPTARGAPSTAVPPSARRHTARSERTPRRARRRGWLRRAAARPGASRGARRGPRPARRRRRCACSSSSAPACGSSSRYFCASGLLRWAVSTSRRRDLLPSELPQRCAGVPTWSRLTIRVLELRRCNDWAQLQDRVTGLLNRSVSCEGRLTAVISVQRSGCCRVVLWISSSSSASSVNAA